MGNGSSSRRPRVLLVDDDAEVSRAVSRLLSPWCDVVGCVPDSEALFDALFELEPEIVVLDFSLRGRLSGIEVCRRLKTMAPGVHTVAFTASNDPDIPDLARDAGASAFVWKPRAADDLLPAIRSLVVF